MDNTRIKELKRMGQSIWIDFLSREMLESGQLEELIGAGITGVTDNPTIFQKAMESSNLYDVSIESLSKTGIAEPEIYSSLIIADVVRAADLLAPIFDNTEGDDGFVSIEVSPHLARNAEGTIVEARHLWEQVSRPNVFVKVPGTTEGLVAIRQLIADGINVNITLLFGIPRYRDTALAYIKGLEDRDRRGLPVDNVRSVASFFLSRIDALLDPQLESIAKIGGPHAALASDLMGETAIASAREAYRNFKEIFFGSRFQTLAAKNCRVQKVLWASTGTKNPRYSDVKYVEPLIGPFTVNTVPLETFNAFRDHGNPSPVLERGIDGAKEKLLRLSDLGIDIDRQTSKLEEEGIAKFTEAYNTVISSLSRHVPV